MTIAAAANALAFNSGTSKSDNVNIIYRELLRKEFFGKRSTKGVDNKQKVATIPVTPELGSLIVAQIKARIHTDITTKLSASLSQKVKASLDIKVTAMGGFVKVGHAEIDAIQTAAVEGLKSRISTTINEKFDQILSDTVTPQVEQLSSFPSAENQKAISVRVVEPILIHAETIARSELKMALPEIRKTLKKRIDAQLNAQIKNLEVDIPGVLKIQINANVNVTSSIGMIIENVYRSYADVSIAVAVKSYIKGLQEGYAK
ncbi:hypothetical protein BDF20DRAFT_911083 [Mycotypha africana]|uniref:uncharacterized protein n=1 Tax=Mycotypha africana TaxID=64632 RepID=UPI0023011A2E|nr:uncharacterized protein BDF20DRAFT_911083 [Mycotypha africana]KAI8988635.1 hypothetical protein BDF20DRAFT_911083 [Mycotypha africana]